MRALATTRLLPRCRENYDQDPWAQLEAWVRVQFPGVGSVVHRWSGSVRAVHFVGGYPLKH